VHPGRECRSSGGISKLSLLEELIMKLNKILFGVAMATAATVALAAWNIDEDGFGFVGKGDVQTAFNWNNKDLQNKAGDVSFTYNNLTAYGYVCEWTTGPDHNRTVHEVTRSRTAGINNNVAYDSRKNSSGKNGDITGFYLIGWGAVIEDNEGEVPTVGDACPGNPGTGAVVTEVNEGASTGGMYVHYKGTTAPL
jgi:hypothetical protein